MQRSRASTMQPASMWKVSLTDVRVSPLVERSQRIPEKYAKLKQAEAAGLTVPKSLLLGGEVSEITQDVIDKFVKDVPNRRFIVRSAHLAEDGSDLSLAGHFWSSGPVVAKDLARTIQQAYAENARVLDFLQSSAQLAAEPLAAPKLILQEYIEHQIGGVLFSPWSFFPDYAYAEYSSSGVKDAVEGLSSGCSVLCLDSHYPDPLPLSITHSALRRGLVELCAKLSKEYDFPIDCEWAYEQGKQQITVLQLRPQTHLVGPILAYSQFMAKGLVQRSENWQFTALSESLGRLSPLSFSLLQQLYIDSMPTFKKLGCKAQSVDFMNLAADGTVLVDPELEQRYYAMTLFGGFQRGMQQAKLIRDAELAFGQYDSLAAFSYQTLKQLFAYWMAANLLSVGEGRGEYEVTNFTEPRHAYELSWPADIEVPIVKEAQSKAVSVESLNAFGRALFLFELNKLKRQLRERLKSGKDQINPLKPNYLFFSNWQALQAEGMTSLNLTQAKDKQHALAPDAVYDYALMGTQNKEQVQALSSTKSVKGNLLIIENPGVTQAQVSADCILIAPYFDNSWVNKIKLMRGIVVQRGGRLSHSAIVAREHGVPYYVVPELDLQALDQGRSVVLDPNTVTRL